MSALFPHWSEELHVLAQSLVALLLGGALGWERQAAGKRAGFRTHMFVALSAMLFVCLGQFLVADTIGRYGENTMRADPIHIIAAIATGVSFLGAGSIFHDSAHEKARGLTTAASLLVTACIGIAVAVDRYIIAVGVTLLALFVLHTLHRLEKPKHPAPQPSVEG